jgi:hypothetical protein
MFRAMGFPIRPVPMNATLFKFAGSLKLVMVKYSDSVVWAQPMLSSRSVIVPLEISQMT